MPAQNQYLSTYQTRGAAVSGRARAAASRAPVERPSARGVVLLIAPFLLAKSLIPATHGIMFRLPPLPEVWWSVNLMLMFAVIVAVFRGLGGFSRRVSRSTKRWVLLPILLLGVWQVVSLAWNGRDGSMRAYSFLQSVCMCAAVLSGVLVSSGHTYATRLRVGRAVTILIGFVIAVYMGLSFVFPGWRPSSAWFDWTTGSLGFIRVFGPLGKSTSLNFILLPVLGFSIGMIFVPGRLRAFWSLLTLFFLVAILSTGSRGGLVSLVAFGFLLMVSLRLRSMALLIPVLIFLSVLASFTGIPERFRDFQAPARVETYATAWRAYTSSPGNVLFGAGHGALYSKLHDDSLRRTYRKGSGFLSRERAAFGFTLRNSHSALVRSLVETGIPGLTFTLVPLAWILRRALASRSRDYRDPKHVHAICTLTGCAAVIPYMALEEFFVAAFWIVFLWTMYVVVGAEGALETGERRTLLPDEVLSVHILPSQVARTQSTRYKKRRGAESVP